LNYFCRLKNSTEAALFEFGRAYTYLPGGKPWDGKDPNWPPGAGATQWKQTQEVPCRLINTLPRGQPDLRVA
jgi:hypothetical protein